MALTGIGILRRWNGVDQTTPFEGGASSSGGANAASNPIALPSTTKTTSGAVVIARVGGKGTATGASTFNATISGLGGFTTANCGTAAAPNSGLNAMGVGLESAASAPGSVTGVVATPNRALASWASRISCLRPSVVGTAPAVSATTFINADMSVNQAFTLTGTNAVGAGKLLILEIFLQDPSATIAAVSPPAGMVWNQAYRQACTDGVIIGLWAVPVDTTGTFTFIASTSTVPTASSPAVISAGHSPALVGDTINVDTNTTYSAPGGDPIQLYVRRPQRNTGSGWADIQSGGSPIEYTSASQGTLAVYTAASGDDGAQVRYASRAQNNAGFSDWSYSNALSVLNAPVVASAPAIITDGTPADGETVTVDVSPSALSTRYTAAAGSIDTYASKWQDDTTGSFADLAGSGGLSSYTLTSGQIGHQVRYAERAHNASGYSAWNYSAPITVQPHPPLAMTDIQTVFAGTGLGGAAGAVMPQTVNGILAAIPGSVAAAGGTFYISAYAKNLHGVDTWPAVAALIQTQFPAAAGESTPNVLLGIGWAPEGLNADVPVRGSLTTAPTGVTFNETSTPQAGGDITAGGRRGFYLRVRVLAGALVTPERDAVYRLAGA